jgi:hypothetical protein
MWGVGVVAFLFYGVLTTGELLYCGCPVAKSAQDCVKCGIVHNSMAVIYLVVVFCFLVNMKFFQSIRHMAFSLWCVGLSY